MRKTENTAREISIPIYMNAPSDRPYVVLTHFTVEQDRSMLFFKRLLGGGKPDITKMLNSQLTKYNGDAIINLQIFGDTDVGDFLLPMAVGAAGSLIFSPVLFFIFEPLFFDLKSYTAEGDIIRFLELAKPKQQLPQFNPLTGLPEQQKIEFDPETGLPKKK